MANSYKHSSERTDWVTPPEIIERARLVMGTIDLDPASSKEVNQQIVGAKRIYTEKTDGLKCKWAGNVWLNPPFGTLIIEGKEVSSQAVWMNRCVDQWGEGEASVSEMLTLFNAATSARWFAPLYNHCAICFPFTRISFVDPETWEYIPGNQYASAIAYWYSDRVGIDRFVSYFGDYGHIVTRYGGFA